MWPLLSASSRCESAWSPGYRTRYPEVADFETSVVFFMTTVLVVVQMRNGGPGGTHSASYV
jgi:hypothetical protein